VELRTTHSCAQVLLCAAAHNKTKYRVRNWSAYDEALRKRGDVTVWFDEDAIEAWTPPRNGQRGGQRRYSNLAIATALTLRVVFHLPFRQTEGFLNSILRLMGLDLAAPDHTTLSRRNKDVDVPRLARNHEGPILPIVDSTGLKVLGDGEWHHRKHKTKTRRIWRKLHIGVDGDGFIVASVLTDSGAGDAVQVPALLDQVDEKIECSTGDGGYDTRGVYDAIAGHQDEPVKVVIPPRKGAARSKTSSRAVAWRNENADRLRRPQSDVRTGDVEILSDRVIRGRGGGNLGSGSIHAPTPFVSPRNHGASVRT
jgi:hypothetical protein